MEFSDSQIKVFEEMERLSQSRFAKSLVKAISLVESDTSKIDDELQIPLEE
jgi:hypothetical protein